MALSKPRLIIGNKAYSSWSMRAWLALVLAELDFEELVIPLDLPDTAATLAAATPLSRVPVLEIDGETVFDSLAIIETVAERAPAAHLWPEDWRARAQARSVVASMHAGFAALRRDMPMDLKREPGPSPAHQTAEAMADVAGVVALWRGCRRRWGAGGDFLFGAVSAADAVFAPVVTRLETYGVALDPDIAAYVAAVEGLPAMQRWRAGAAAEPWVLTGH